MAAALVSLLSALSGQQVAAPCAHVTLPALLRIAGVGSAPFGARKEVERLNSLFSHPPCHTILAPVAVNEHRAAPISHAQVVYLRGNEGLSLLASNTAVLPGARECATGL